MSLLCLSECHYFTTPTGEGWSHKDRSPLVRFSGGLGRNREHVIPVSSCRCRTRCARRPRCRCRGCESDVPDTLAFLVHGALTLSVPDALAPNALASDALAPDVLTHDASAPSAPGACALECQFCQY